MSESEWIHRAQSAEASLNTLRDQMDRIREESRGVLELFCARKKGDGSYDIDFAGFVERIGLEQAIELRRVIDDAHNVSGAPGEKPRVRLAASG